MKEINDASSNVLQAMGVLLFGKHLGNIMVLAVALSTIATLETTLLQVTRTLFSMGRDGVISKRFARVHPTRRTPYFANIVVGVFAMVLFVLSNFLPSVNKVMTDAISSIGLQVVFYYALAAISVIFYYRKILFQSVTNFFLLFLWPLVAAVFLLIVGIADVPSLDATTDIIGLGLIIIGIGPLFWGRILNRPSFYEQQREYFIPEVDQNTSDGLSVQ